MTRSIAPRANPSSVEQISAAIVALESQRAVMGDAVAEAALAPLRARLASLSMQLRESARHEQVLRQVTVLFADIVGSTALSQHFSTLKMCTGC